MLLRYHRSKTWKLESLKMCFSTDATTMWHCYKMWKAFQIPASPFERTPHVWRKPAVTVENDERGAAICQDTHAVSFCLVQPPVLEVEKCCIGAQGKRMPQTPVHASCFPSSAHDPKDRLRTNAVLWAESGQSGCLSWARKGSLNVPPALTHLKIPFGESVRASAGLPQHSILPCRRASPAASTARNAHVCAYPADTIT